MTDLLKKAVKKVERLPDDQQDAIASLILDELKDDDRWEASFAESPELLERLANEAEREHKKGNTEPLDPENL
jgi:hypothetical protein